VAPTLALKHKRLVWVRQLIDTRASARAGGVRWRRCDQRRRQR